MLENLKSFYKKYEIKKFSDFPTIGAYIVFNKLEDKVKVYKLF